MLGQGFSMQNFIHFIRKNLQNFVHLQTLVIQINLPLNAIGSVVSDIFEWMIWCEIKNATLKVLWYFYENVYENSAQFSSICKLFYIQTFFIVEISFLPWICSMDTTSQNLIIFLLFIPLFSLSHILSRFQFFFQSYILCSSFRLEVMGHSAENVYLLAMKRSTIITHI